ncbi:MAG: NAD-dependent epimerase/dehydratase family protein [Oribacterium sp.]
MRIVISGVSSFLGRASAEALLARGHHVIGIVRPGSRNTAGLQDAGLRALRLVRFDFDTLPTAEEGRYRAAFSEAMGRDAQTAVIDGWIHFAWDGVGPAGRQDPEIQTRNVENAKKAYRMAELLGAGKFLFAGSQAEYGNGTKSAPQPVSAYGSAKLRFGEWAAAESRKQGTMAFLHLRIYSVYGYGDHPTTLTNTLSRACLSGDGFALGPCTQRWNYLEIRDFAAALCLLTEQTAAGNGIYDIAGESTKPLRDYVLEGAETLLSAGDSAAGAGFRLHFGVRRDNAEGTAGMDPDIRRLSALGFRQQISFREGMLELRRRILEEQG